MLKEKKKPLRDFCLNRKEILARSFEGLVGGSISTALEPPKFWQTEMSVKTKHESGSGGFQA